jgi:hypothetical protein
MLTPFPGTFPRSCLQVGAFSATCQGSEVRQVKVSRASFLKVCAAGLAGAGVHAQSLLGDVVLQAAAGAALPAAGSFDWTRASAALFRPHVTTSFTTISEDGSPTTLVLDRVDERPCRPDIEQFSLLFHGTPAAVGYGVYTVRHAALGEFDMFLAPVRGQGDQGSYEACVSRHVGRSERA